MSAIRVLDHGYVELVESWGSDERIIEAARMSTQSGFVSWEPYENHPKGDMGLLRFLWKNKHMTPFEMAGLTIEVKAPIMVFREWHRHRTQSYNEMSARYAPLPNENYMPSVERLLQGGGHLTKQAGTIAGVDAVDSKGAAEFVEMLKAHYAAGEELYQRGLQMGVAKEIARLAVPVGRYSKMRASANLRNWLAFLTLRRDPKAQHEIQEYARAVATLIEQRFPRTWEVYLADLQASQPPAPGKETV